MFNSNAKAVSSKATETKVTNVGMFTPNIKKAKEGKNYEAVIRFLPNLKADGSAGDAFIKREQHYFQPEAFTNIVALPSDLKGYYDSFKEHNISKCPLEQTFWYFWRKGKDEGDAKKYQTEMNGIKCNTSYYAYVYVIANESEPDTVGKVLVYKFSKTVADKIQACLDGNVTKKLGQKIETDPFDLLEGVNFNLTLKKKGNTDWADYADCQFDTSRSALPIDGVEITKADREMVKDLLLSRKVELESFLPKPLTPEIIAKCNKIHESLTSGVNMFYKTSKVEEMFKEDDQIGKTVTIKPGMSMMSSFDDDNQ